MDPFELLGQRPIAIADDDAGDRLQQDAVPIVDLVGRAHEDATGLVDAVGAAACCDQLRDLLVQREPVTVVVFAEDHQIHHQSVHAPIRVGLYELAQQTDIRRVCNCQQDDRQIAGDSVSPQTGLTPEIPGEYARVSAQRSVGVDDRTGKACIESRIRFAGVEPAQDRLVTRRRGGDYAIRAPPILVSPDQPHARFACLADAADQINGCGFTGIERDATANRSHRIEHGTCAPRQGRLVMQYLRISRAAAATDELQAVRLVRDFSRCRLMRGQQVKHPWRRLIGGTRPTSAQDRLALTDDLGFDKQFAERRVCRIRGRRCEHDFRVARYIDAPARARAVANARPAHLDVIFRRNGDFGMRFDIVVAASEYRAPLRKHCFVDIRPLQRRLIRG